MISNKTLAATGVLSVIALSGCTQNDELLAQNTEPPIPPACTLDVLPDLKGVHFSSTDHDGNACKVTGTIENDIRFEVNLPDAWNGRFVMSGGGGFAGVVTNIVEPTFPNRGYVTAATDTGHQAHPIDASWAVGHPERLENFAGTAIHLTTKTTKQIIQAYYQKESERNLFYGCSRGGGQALYAAQRYPYDYDAIIAGAPAYNWTHHLGGHFAMIGAAMFPNSADLSEAIIGKREQRLINQAVMKQCDAKDGLEDGIITEPWRCDFDIRSLQCDDSNEGQCLTEPQINALEIVYHGAYDSQGQQIAPGFFFGAEMSASGMTRWLTGGTEVNQFSKFQDGIDTNGFLVPDNIPNASYGFATGIMRDFIFNGEAVDFTLYQFDNLSSDGQQVAQLLNATNPDLSEFRNNGGKLILWTGLNDMAISPQSTIDYYQAVLEHDASAAEDVRLFLLPGVDHCAGGAGPFWVDFIEEAEGWLNTGDAPQESTAHWFTPDKGLEGNRKICAHPKVAYYDGSGDPRSADSFYCSYPK
ncbi:tannase/feruloyl esterase family alpha/beta hydrolase [Vibrio hangzhouensis]|uniref:tannase/feruloyl esterase family alpha/beta hydrolase n=1 Tax=Vibrio hangzhouensis TaxID=462991 RepID=UPI001C93A38F|nr:tannase/feruloyl esterase family alpha/beta hydrolase [Vibrio hangzhouensis]MBY6196072.1 tannase/feruloyl esterase family alpha/beta hydrolase [Vibrio hangzhouensis]